MGQLSIKSQLVETLQKKKSLSKQWLAIIPLSEFVEHDWIHGFMTAKVIFLTLFIYYLIFFFFVLKVYIANSQELSYVVKELKPYRIYNFTISLCNSIGCVTSASGTGQTLAAGKRDLMDMKNTLCPYKQPIKLNTFSNLDLILVFSGFSCSPVANSDCYLH